MADGPNNELHKETTRLGAGSLCRSLDLVNDREFPVVHHVWKKMLRHQRSLSSPTDIASL